MGFIIYYPNATSKSIIITKPIPTLIVTKFDFLLACASGISSDDTTYIIAPAANDRKYGKIGTTILVNAMVIIAPIGSTIPDKVPPKNDLNLLFPEL